MSPQNAWKTRILYPKQTVQLIHAVGYGDGQKVATVHYIPVYVYRHDILPIPTGSAVCILRNSLVFHFAGSSTVYPVQLIHLWFPPISFNSVHGLINQNRPYTDKKLMQMKVQCSTFKRNFMNLSKQCFHEKCNFEGQINLAMSGGGHHFYKITTPQVWYRHCWPHRSLKSLNRS